MRPRVIAIFGEREAERLPLLAREVPADVSWALHLRFALVLGGDDDALGSTRSEDRNAVEISGTGTGTGTGTTGTAVLSAALALRAELGAPIVASVAPAVMRGERLDGVHLGGARRGELRAVREELGPDAWISVPAHTDEEVSEAAVAGASAVYVSPIFETPGKGPARGLRVIGEARRRAGGMLVYALGGVTAETAEACAAAGADGVAVIRAIAGAERPGDALVALDLAVRRGLTSRGV